MNRIASALLVTISLLGAACTAPALFATPTVVPPSATAALPLPAEPPPVSASPAGPVEITGKFQYTNTIITDYYVEHAVALVDMYAFVVRDLEWEIPIRSQTLGFLKIDAENQTGEYWLQLPARPDGQFVAFGPGEAEGVQVFAVAYWPNLTGGPYSEGDDPSFGWPSYLASVKTDAENKDEVVGGRLVVWAPDDRQRFPTGFGADGLLFTADDPLGRLPAGYSIIDLDRTPFDISQEASPALELYEPEDAAIKDYSQLGYSEAFDRLFEKASAEWAFNGAPGKNVDWPALYDEIAPRVAEAERNGDALAYYRALHDFTRSIPDGHTGLSGGALADRDFRESTEGGYGFAIRELDSGRVIVTYLTTGGPAEAAGMQVGAEITRFDGRPIADAIGQVNPYAGPFSLASSLRYQQARYLLRTSPGSQAEVTFVNPGGEPQTVTLTAIAERDSFAVTSITYGFDSNALPVESRLLDSGIGYLKMNSNYDDLGLIVRLFERALRVFQANDVPAIIIDMRQNSGGANLGLAGLLYDQEIPLGQLEYYSEKTGQFEPEGPPDKVLPNQTQYPFDQIAILVSPACASACELEAYAFSKIPGAMVVGMYPTAGVEAEVARGQFLLPEGLGVQIPTGRFVNPDGSLFLEGQGLAPTVRVPVDERSVLSSEDAILQAAEDAIFGIGPDDLKIEGGPVLGSPASTEKAARANTRSLEQAAQERYSSSDLAEMGRTFTYTVNLDRDQRLLWGYGWCATSADILRQNFEHITVEFTLNDAAIEPARFAVIEDESGGLACRSYYAVVFKWPSGETHLQTVVTFDAAINDGLDDYPPGQQTFDYTLTLP